MLDFILDGDRDDLIDLNNGIVLVKSPLLGNLLLSKYDNLAAKSSMKGWKEACRFMTSDLKRFFLREGEFTSFAKSSIDVTQSFMDNLNNVLISQGNFSLFDVKNILFKSLLKFFFSVEVEEKDVVRFIQASSFVEKYRSISSWPHKDLNSEVLSEGLFLQSLEDQREVGKTILTVVTKKENTEYQPSDVEAVTAFLIAIVSPLSSILFSSLSFHLKGVFDLGKILKENQNDFVSNELFRYFSPAWFLTRKIVKSIKINNFTLSENTTLVFPIYYYHKRKDIWGDDSDRLIPERFSRMSLLQTKSYFPFGHGERMCPASRFSKILLVKMLESILLLDIDLIKSDCNEKLYWTVLWRDVNNLIGFKVNV